MALLPTFGHILFSTTSRLGNLLTIRIMQFTFANVWLPTTTFAYTNSAHAEKNYCLALQSDGLPDMWL